VPRSSFSYFVIPVAALALASLVSAQVVTPPPFAIRLQQGQNAANISDGATITMPSDGIGLAAPVVSLTITYTGTSINPAAQVTGIDLTGSTDFSLGTVPDLPTSLLPKQFFYMTVNYKPTTSNRNPGKIVFSYLDAGKTGTFTLNLVGTAPEFAFSYVPPGGNQSNISSGGKITFPVTAIDSTSIATFVLTNRGTGQGLVNMISLDNTNFQLAGVPLPNSYLDAGKDLRFSVTFTANQIDPVTGNLVVDLPTGRFVFGLEGSGSGPVFSYTSVADSTLTSLLSGQLVTLPDATLGDKSSIVIRVQNDGNADGRITAISASGTGFTVSDAPFLPFTLTAGSSVNVTVTFTPTQSGKSTGRLRIGSDSFELAANGVGPVLAYSYTVGTTTTTIQNGGSVIFTPVAVGKSAAARFVVTNNGTAPTSVSSISISGATPASTNPIFVVTDLPTLPTSVPSGGIIAFTVNFAPSTTGAASATLKVDTQSFTLSASANPPPALPDYRFDGASGTQAPLTQPLVGLLLSQSYPINLTGTLTLGFNSDVGVTDPSVQFAFGGKTVNFTIPANTTRAIFSNGAQQVRVQTGSVAGAITLTPSFITDGGISLTPTNPPFQSLPIVQSAPVLMSLQLAAKTTNSFSIQATGYATGRSVTQIDVQLTPTSGENVQTTKVSIAAEPSFLAWYANSLLSQPYGSLFTVTIPFTVAGDVKNVTNVVDTIQSVSVTLTNRQGTSPAMTLSLK
jgi:hypothetical protein